MKIKFGFISMLVVSMFFATACSDDEEPVAPPTGGTETFLSVPDGWYVIGDGTAVNDTAKAVLSKGLMLAEPNEANKDVVREGLVGIYVAVEAGAEGFNIIHVEGGVPTYYGPDAVAVDETIAPAGTQKGMIKESTDKFTVEADGLYHVVYDELSGTVLVIPIKQGLIGAATPGGWSTETEMTTTFNLNTMTFTVADVVLINGSEYKFRAGAWNVPITTDGTDEIRACNDWAGASIDELVLGKGANLVVPSSETAAKSHYAVSITWTLGAAVQTATMVKGDDVLIATDWSATTVDAIGAGIADQAGSVVSTTWGNWGYTYLCTEPVVINGDVYTWTWNSVTLIKDAGFKVRSEGGVAPAVGGANFDCGTANVDLANSPLVNSTAGDITVSADGNYKIVLTIDAGNMDAKTVTITAVQ